MRRANIIEKDMQGIGTLKDLTNVFESLASTQVAKVKNKIFLLKVRQMRLNHKVIIFSKDVSRRNVNAL
jgi:hypothetical protein